MRSVVNRNVVMRRIPIHMSYVRLLIYVTVAQSAPRYISQYVR